MIIFSINLAQSLNRLQANALLSLAPPSYLKLSVLFKVISFYVIIFSTITKPKHTTYISTNLQEHWLPYFTKPHFPHLHYFLTQSYHYTSSLFILICSVLSRAFFFFLHYNLAHVQRNPVFFPPPFVLIFCFTWRPLPLFITCSSLLHSTHSIKNCNYWITGANYLLQFC